MYNKQATLGLRAWLFEMYTCHWEHEKTPSALAGSAILFLCLYNGRMFILWQLVFCGSVHSINETVKIEMLLSSL